MVRLCTQSAVAGAHPLEPDEELDDVATFLGERLAGIGVSVAPCEGRGDLELSVAMVERGQLSLTLREGDVVLAERALAAIDRTYSKLMAWLFVKSAFERRRIATVRPEDAPTHVLPEPSPASAPGERDPWRLAVSLVSVNEAENAWSTGFGVGAAYVTRVSLLGELQAGYRLGPWFTGLVMHHFGARAAVAALLGAGARLGVALDGQLELAAAAQREGGSVVVPLWGMAAEAYCQVGVPLTLGTLLVGLGVQRRILSHTLVWDRGRITENPWALRVSLSLEYGGRN